MSKIPLKIEIVSDVVCPWCIIGFKRLELALSRCSDRIQAELHWHPFQLNPHIPEGGQNLREHLAQKYGTTLEQSIAARKRLTELGASLRFTFNYYDEMRTYNTFKAHQLLHWAKEQGKQTELQMQLFSAYFSDRQAIDQIEPLLEAADRVGLDAIEARNILETGLYTDAIEQMKSQWIQRGIHAAPTFIFNEKEMIFGAQSVEIFTAQLEEFALETA
ncbi:MAG: DsbA family oxidoreductase [Cyanobacteria bacterium P01_E01_bin.42]